MDNYDDLVLSDKKEKHRIRSMKDLYCVITAENYERVTADIVNLIKSIAVIKQCEHEVPPENWSFNWLDDRSVYTTVKSDLDGIELTFEPSNNGGIHVTSKKI